MEVMKLSGKRIAEEIQVNRKKNGLSQQQLADSVGVARATISNLERNKQSLSLDLFCRIAVSLSMSPSLLLERILLKESPIDLSGIGIPIKVQRTIEETMVKPRAKGVKTYV